MKDVKFVITDLDNTILRTDKSISDYTLNVISECQSRGILFAISTARSNKAAKKYIDILKPDIIITNGGACTKYNNEIIREKVLSVELTNAIIDDLKTNEGIGIISLETTEQYYTNDIRHDLWDDDYSHVIYNDFNAPIFLPTYKIPFQYYDINAVKEISEKYKNIETIFFRDENWVTFSNNEATKEKAVEDLVQYLGININRVIAFGDDINDIGMIQCCGKGIAVKNAIIDLKSIADYICKSNNNDGVAHFIEDNCF